MDVEDRIGFFGDMLNTVSSSCYLWTYDGKGNLLETTCDEACLEIFFRRSSFDYMTAYAHVHTEPLIMSSEDGLIWGAAFRMDGNSLVKIYVIGPVLTLMPTKKALEDLIHSVHIPQAPEGSLMAALERLSIFNITQFFDLLIGLEYAVSGKRLTSSDICLQQTLSPALRKDNIFDEQHRADRNQVYKTEQSLLQMIREGKLNEDEWANSGRVFTGNQKLSLNSLQHAKLSQVQFIALCSRAAIEGGLSPEVSYSRNDAYIKNVENCKTVSEIIQVGRKMYMDFVELVHKQKADPSISKAIRACCDYIDEHLGDKISVSALASHVGYSDYYLSRLFKQQTGRSINEFIRDKRIERAKFLLINTMESIQEISNQLGFSNRNYFTQVFTEETGQSPALYKKENQRI